MDDELTPEQQAKLDRWRTALSEAHPDNTFLPNPDDATSFYQFMGGVAYKMPCPAGLIFNPDADPGPVCDWPMNVSKEVNPAPR